MVIPAAHGDLNEAHAGLAQFPCEQAGATVLVGVLSADAVELLGGVGLAGDVDDLRGRCLHPERELKILDHALHARVALELAGEAAVHALHEVDARALGLGGGGGVAEVLDREVLSSRNAERRALVDGGKEG